MKLHALILTGLCATSSFAESVDPRILESMRIERNVVQRFCDTFAREPIGNGLIVAQTCVNYSQGRYQGDFRLAKKDPRAFEMDAVISRSQTEFCMAIGEYTQPAPWVATDCLAWNQNRSELFRLATTAGTPELVLETKIRSVEETRRRFCLSVQNAGYPGSPEVFWARINSCFTLTITATKTDRAIILDDYL